MSTPDPRLSQLQRMIAAYRQSILTLDDAALSRLQASYAPSRQRLLSVIDALTGQIQAGAKLTSTEAMQLGRARELLRLIEQEVTSLANVAGQTIPQAQQIAVQQAVERAQALTLAQAPDLASAARISAQWTALNKGAVSDLVGSLGDGSPLSSWIERVVPESVQTVRDTLLDGVTRGINPNDLARALAQATDLPLQRALTLSRTETLRAYRSASLASFSAQGDVLSGWQWSCAPSGACLACQAKDGDVYPLSTQFFPSHPRCITGNTRIQAEGVKAVSKRWYSGSLIEIETMRGHRLSVTPNHPLLTPEGWVSAGLVKEGDDLISSNGEQWSLISDDHDKDIPPCVEEVAHALSMTSGVFTIEMPSATPHFHGDGMEGEVNVIYADRELGRRVQSALVEQFGERHFVMTDMDLVSLTTGSHAFFDVDRLGDTAQRVMRSGDELLPFVSGHFARPEIHAGAAIARRHTCQDQPITNDRSRHTKMRGGRLFGFTGLIERDDRFVIDSSVRSMASTALRSGQLIPFGLGPIDTHFDQLRLQPIGPEAANLFANGLHPFTGDIAPDRVVKLVVRAFEGHVYNLESENGYYFASGIITHNCRCSPLPVLKNDSLLPDIETAGDRFRALPMDEQLKALPIGARAEYRAGRLTLDDFVHERHDPEWGTSVQTASISQARANARARRSGGGRFAAGG